MMAGCVKECTRADDDRVLEVLRLRDRWFDSGQIARRLDQATRDAEQ